MADLLADKLEAQPSDSLYSDVVQAIHEARDGLNEDYVMAKLETFIRRQSLRSVAGDLTKALNRDTEESLDEAEKLIRRATQTGVALFDPGTRLSDKDRALEFLNITNDSFPTGIEELDKRGFGPTRKELWLLIANAKRGKSWALTHVSKMALSQRLKVVHISLEMSEARTSQRYFQAMFAIAKRQDKYPSVRFKRDELGRVVSLNDVYVKPSMTMDDPDAQNKLEKLIDKWALRRLDNIIVKQFPTGGLTVPQLRAYLDNLENTARFTPDLLIVDYPDLMKIDKSNFRLSIDEIYKELRGIAVERNIAVAVVSQSHRGSAKAKLVGADNVAEAYSKIAHADCILTYSQTEAEEKLGLARLHVAGGRNDGDKITVVVSQQYAIGAFALDSNIVTGGYFNALPEGSEGGDDGE